MYVLLIILMLKICVFNKRNRVGEKKEKSFFYFCLLIVVFLFFAFLLIYLLIFFNFDFLNF